ncbi:MAG: hypothetical protein IKW13_01395, partial [Thermoguttaceae bacterium]|nr:hypothetical protein [Thermoguttaceae bacterium]
SNQADYSKCAELAGDAFSAAAEATDDEAQKANCWNKAAKHYDRAKLWAKAFEVCEKALATNFELELGRLRRGRARFFLAFEENRPVDWRALALDLDGAELPTAKRFTDEPDEYWAETWVIRALCGCDKAENATDESARQRGYRDVLAAIDEALKEDAALKYTFGGTTFHIDAIGSQVATRLYELTKNDEYRKVARRYARMEFDRNRPNERQVVLE